MGHYDDRLSIQVIAHKALDDGQGQLREVLLHDYVPVALLDEQDRVIYRELIQPYTAGRANKAFWLPRPKNAVAVVIDPLGAWPDATRFDNRKTLFRQL